MSNIGALPFADFSELFAPLVSTIRRNQQLTPASTNIRLLRKIQHTHTHDTGKDAKEEDDLFSIS